MELVLPIDGHPSGRSGHGLVERVMTGRREERTLKILLLRVIPEPVLTRLVALHDRMSCSGRVATRVLGRRGVAAPDAAAMGAAAEMEPPAIGGHTFEATWTARRYRRVDVRALCQESPPRCVDLVPRIHPSVDQSLVFGVGANVASNVRAHRPNPQAAIADVVENVPDEALTQMSAGIGRVNLRVDEGDLPSVDRIADRSSELAVDGQLVASTIRMVDRFDDVVHRCDPRTAGFVINRFFGGRPPGARGLRLEGTAGGVLQALRHGQLETPSHPRSRREKRVTPGARPDCKNSSRRRSFGLGAQAIPPEAVVLNRQDLGPAEPRLTGVPGYGRSADDRPRGRRRLLNQAAWQANGRADGIEEPLGRVLEGRSGECISGSFIEHEDTSSGREA